MESTKINSVGESCSFCGKGSKEHGQLTITSVSAAGQRIRSGEPCKKDIAAQIEQGHTEDNQFVLEIGGRAVFLLVFVMVIGIVLL